MQLIQRAKCYQTVVRLGTYTAKVPIYNSLKACKGTMFFLPLPMNKTIETPDQVKDSSSNLAQKCWLPNPELFIKNSVVVMTGLVQICSLLVIFFSQW